MIEEKSIPRILCDVIERSLRLLDTHNHYIGKNQVEEPPRLRICERRGDYRLRSLSEIDSTSDYELVFLDSAIQLALTGQHHSQVVAEFEYADPKLFENIAGWLERYNIRLVLPPNEYRSRTIRDAKTSKQ